MTLVVPVAAPPPPAVPVGPARPNVAAGVKCWRRHRGLTQKQLAVASQLPRTYISRIENGRITPGLVTLERVAIALTVSLPALLAPAPERRNGHANGNGNGSANGNGTGANGSYNGNGHRLAFSPAYLTRQNGQGSELDAFLRDLLRYSGALTGNQRYQVLSRVRQMLTPHLIAH